MRIYGTGYKGWQGFVWSTEIRCPVYGSTVLCTQPWRLCSLCDITKQVTVSSQKWPLRHHHPHCFCDWLPAICKKFTQEWDMWYLSKGVPRKCVALAHPYRKAEYCTLNCVEFLVLQWCCFLKGWDSIICEPKDSSRLLSVCRVSVYSWPVRIILSLQIDHQPFPYLARYRLMGLSVSVYTTVRVSVYVIICFMNFELHKDKQSFHSNVLSSWYKYII